LIIFDCFLCAGASIDEDLFLSDIHDHCFVLSHIFRFLYSWAVSILGGKSSLSEGSKYFFICKFNNNEQVRNIGNKFRYRLAIFGKRSIHQLCFLGRYLLQAVNFANHKVTLVLLENIGLSEVYLSEIAVLMNATCEWWFFKRSFISFILFSLENFSKYNRSWLVIWIANVTSVRSFCESFSIRRSRHLYIAWSKKRRRITFLRGPCIIYFLFDCWWGYRHRERLFKFILLLLLYFAFELIFIIL